MKIISILIIPVRKTSQNERVSFGATKWTWPRDTDLGYPKFSVWTEAVSRSVYSFTEQSESRQV